MVESDRNRTVVVTMTGSELSNEVAVANKFIRRHAEKHSTSSTEQPDKTHEVWRQIQSRGDVWGVIEEQTKVNKEETVFLFLVDESQNTGSSQSSSTGLNLITSTLNDGFQSTAGIKVVPIFTGLSNTSSVLASRRVSKIRGDAPTRLEPLTQTETSDLVSRWMQYDGFEFEDLFTPDDITRVSNMIAVASDGWPRHAYSYLRVIAQAVLERRVGNNLEINIDDTLKRGHADLFAY